MSSQIFAWILSSNPRLLRCIEILLLVGLWAVFIAPLTHIGIAHTDDGIWALAAHEGTDPVSEWSKSQGRIWPLLSGRVLLFASGLYGTSWEPILQYTAMTLCFVLVVTILSTKLNLSVSALVMTLFITTTAVRWDGSLLFSYPLFTWFFGALFLLALLIVVTSSPTKNGWLISASYVLFWFSLFLQEGLTAIFAAIYLTTCIVRAYGGLSEMVNELRKKHLDRRIRLVVAPTAVFASYLLLYAAWRLTHSSNYAGNKIDKLAPRESINVMWHFIGSGSIFYDSIETYSFPVRNFVSDPIAGTIFNHSSINYLDPAIWPFTAFVAVMVTLLLITTLLVSRGDLFETLSAKSSRLFVVGLVVAFFPVMFTSLTPQYRSWVNDLGVHAFPYTPICYFGISICLAALILVLLRAVSSHSRARLAISVVVVGVLAMCAGVSTASNRALSEVIQDEASRWDAVAAMAHMAKDIAESEIAVYAPRLGSGSWFSVVGESYWTRYALARYHIHLRFIVESDLVGDDWRGPVFLSDFHHVAGERGMIVTMGSLSAPEKGGGVTIRDLYVWSKGVQRDDRRNTITYLAQMGDVRSLEIGTLPQVNSDRALRVMKGVNADARSISIAGASPVVRLRIACGNELSLGVTIRFSNSGAGCSAAGYLSSGWYPPEPEGTWTKGSTAYLQLPHIEASGMALKLSFDVGSFVSLGFYDSSQDVGVDVNDVPMARWHFSFGQEVSGTDIVIPGSLASLPGPLKITFSIIDPIIPAHVGVSSDQRNLGLYLRSVRPTVLSNE